jgi:hypothetical protein
LADDKGHGLNSYTVDTQGLGRKVGPSSSSGLRMEDVSDLSNPESEKI